MVLGLIQITFTPFFPSKFGYRRGNGDRAGQVLQHSVRQESVNFSVLGEGE